MLHSVTPPTPHPIPAHLSSFRSGGVTPHPPRSPSADSSSLTPSSPLSWSLTPPLCFSFCSAIAALIDVSGSRPRHPYPQAAVGSVANSLAVLCIATESRWGVSISSLCPVLPRVLVCSGAAPVRRSGDPAPSPALRSLHPNPGHCNSPAFLAPLPFPPLAGVMVVDASRFGSPFSRFRCLWCAWLKIEPLSCAGSVGCLDGLQHNIQEPESSP